MNEVRGEHVDEIETFRISDYHLLRQNRLYNCPSVSLGDWLKDPQWVAKSGC